MSRVEYLPLGLRAALVVGLCGLLPTAAVVEVVQNLRHREEEVCDG